MAVMQEPRLNRRMQVPSQRAALTAPEHGAVMTPAGAKTFAIVRIVTGFVFLWAFLDKTFGWGYATPAGKGWIDGGSPTKGFLSGVAVGPLESTFHDIAGAGWANWLFMLGLLGIGVALLSGVALRLTAAAGSLMMMLMWAAEWPLAQHLSNGAPSMSTNPVADYHLIYALVLIALAAAYAGNTWGLGRKWAELPIVRKNRWLL
ncbi:DoxX family membrane protein [Streptomyces sp. WAC 00631]|uniref:DoxX family membrane protein n=1 Tax=unclassified Streptomyces TaxID=2593676 RepID=UPI000F7B8064|nr:MULTISPECIES: DoxX family membrane protein [unclassified Streptomyces]MCC5033462.1 DoxX family membrane protein [Streptomyces sp. WAC 00631]MCC9741550.1 DoxX family membrane protein [Streptomyces sp. MNU89]